MVILSLNGAFPQELPPINTKTDSYFDLETWTQTLAIRLRKTAKQTARTLGARVTLHRRQVTETGI